MTFDAVVDNHDTVQAFRLEAGRHSVELCNVGASVTALTFDGSDVVLGYASNQALHESGNPMYLGAVVGRVANRIANGRFQIHQGGATSLLDYQLELNDGFHHLHGGTYGFHSQIWTAKRLSNSNIQFTYLSPDGDQGYPGSVLVSALYSLNSASNDSLVLTLTLSAQLLPGGDGTMKATPINLAQHSYFNLSGHDSQEGILNHVLWMPQAIAFLPVDDHCIPTKRVIPLQYQEAHVLDFRRGQTLFHALTLIAQDKFKDHDAAVTVNLLREVSEYCKPFGIDVSFVLDPNSTVNHSSCNGVSQQQLPSSMQPDLHIAAVLEHPASRRRLTVYTNAPAVQVYTGHYLNRKAHDSIENGFRKGMNPTHEMYPPFSGICLETQHFPDSIDPTIESRSMRGQCPILVPGLFEHYTQKIEYHFDLTTL